MPAGHTYVGRSTGWSGEGRLGRLTILEVPNVDTLLADRPMSPRRRARPSIFDLEAPGDCPDFGRAVDERPYNDHVSGL